MTAFHHSFEGTVLREYDIRGIVGKTLQPEDAFAIGRCFGSLIVRAEGTKVAVGGALLARLALKLPWRAAVFIGLAVFSHWIADLLVHRPDLALWAGGPKVGLGLWNAPVAEQAVEIGLLAVAAVFWTGWRVREGRSVWPAGLFLAFLTALQIYALSAPEGGGPIQMGAVTLAAYLVVAFVAWLAERGPATRIG